MFSSTAQHLRRDWGTSESSYQNTGFVNARMPHSSTVTQIVVKVPASDKPAHGVGV